MQIGIFDGVQKFTINKPIRLIELDNLEIIVSSIGDIYTQKRENPRKNGRKDNRNGKKLKPSKDKYGYLRVVITNNGKRKTYLVHRLVARAFLKDYNNELQVNHKDGNKINNNLSNIEMVTLQENIRHSIEYGLKPKMKRDKLGRYVSCEKGVIV